MSFERKAPSVWFAAAILAAATAGCALEGADSTAEATASNAAQLQGAATHAVPVALPHAASPATGAAVHAPPVAANAVTLVPLESPGLPSAGGDTSDDPRPHPWEPTPADNAQQGSSQGSTSTGSSK